MILLRLRRVASITEQVACISEKRRVHKVTRVTCVRASRVRWIAPFANLWSDRQVGCQPCTCALLAVVWKGVVGVGTHGSTLAACCFAHSICTMSLDAHFFLDNRVCLEPNTGSVVFHAVFHVWEGSFLAIITNAVNTWRVPVTTPNRR